jgi:predicted metal-dependent hydrolase
LSEPSPPVPPQLSDEEAGLFRQGIEQLNTGYFFECHETLEDLWHGVRGPSRDFFQGLIQLSVAFYHVTRDNHAGARSMLERAMGRLSKYPDDYGGIDLGSLRAEAAALRKHLDDGTLGNDPIFPRCRFRED